MDLRSRQAVVEYFSASAEALRATGEVCADELLVTGEVLASAVRNGGKLLLAGNGGSAADAQHFAAELVGRLGRDFERPAIPAIALSTDTSILTAYANDYDFEGVFARQVEALGRPGDALLLLSTSGRSPNLLRAAAMAERGGVQRIGLLGGDGGWLLALVDRAVVVPGADTLQIQECQSAVIHVLCSLIERSLHDGGSAQG